MNRVIVSLIVYALLTSILTIFLVLVGESRPDAYLSVAILIYFIFTAIDNSIRSRAKMLAVDIALLTVFTAMVLFRVLIVLEVIR
ncbi:MAG: hypothetical protein QW101_00310 [Ignisphaera sp.]|uniref:Uncharacterized protein n=1 Tax=Ignisphaera aggregans TaxID=334771 RepID=A0A832A9Z7_9CREN